MCTIRKGARGVSHNWRALLRFVAVCCAIVLSAGFMGMLHMTSVQQVTFEVVQRHALTSNVEQHILSLCFQAWGEEFAPLWPTSSDSTHVVASLQGHVISHAMTVTRWLQPADSVLLRTAYVEAVVTDVAYQGQGIGTAVMQRLQATMTDFDMGGLSPARYAFYERLGWELWRGPLAVRTAARLVATPDEELMILRLPRTPLINLDDPISVEWREGEVW